MPRSAILLRTLDYTAMRMLRLRAALVDFLRRWGIYFAIVVVLFSAGTNAPVAIAAALAGLFVAPLRFAAAHGALLVPTTFGYAVVGTLPVMLTRPLWWPRQWAAAERALPLPVAVIARSDRLFAALLMAPWQAVLVLGGVGTWYGDGATVVLWRAVVGWLLSAAGSLHLSMLWMRFVRHRAGGIRVETKCIAVDRDRRVLRPVGVRLAAILLPMLRGRARRSTVASLGGPLVVLTGAFVPACAGWSIGWAYAFAAAVALSGTSMLRAATIRELRPLWQDSRHLPLDPRACERARFGLTLLPLGACALACLLAASLTSSPIRPQVGVLYGIVVAAGCIMEALTPPQTLASDHAARWLLMLIAALAFASEISPS